MTILNFVTQEELDDLDGDDPRLAFMTLVNHAQRRLSEQTSKLDPENRYEWEHREELRHSFMNVVVAAGKRLEIEPFVSMDVPRYADFGDNEHRQFQRDLDHYITQIMLDNSLKSKRSSVAIPLDAKDKIRSYVHGLRSCIEKSTMHKAKRIALLDKLDAFENELEKRRTNLLAVALLTFEVLGIPGATWASVDIVHRLVNNVMQTVADAKAIEQETRQLPPLEPPKALSAPRAEAISAPELDDEIPF